MGSPWTGGQCFVHHPPLADEDRYEECLQKVLVKVENELLEVARRVTESVLRDRGFPSMSTLNFEDIVKEVEMQCPTVFKLLSQMIQLSQNYDKKTASLALIYGIIIFRRCKEMSRVQRVNTVMRLNDGGASQEVCLLKLTCGITIWNV